jgi:hypothetical protein
MLIAKLFGYGYAVRSSFCHFQFSSITPCHCLIHSSKRGKRGAANRKAQRLSIGAPLGPGFGLNRSGKYRVSGDTIGRLIGQGHNSGAAGLGTAASRYTPVRCVPAKELRHEIQASKMHVL